MARHRCRMNRHLDPPGGGPGPPLTPGLRPLITPLSLSHGVWPVTKNVWVRIDAMSLTFNQNSVAPCSDVTSPWRWRQHGPPKVEYPTATLHGVITQNAATSNTLKSINKDDVCRWTKSPVFVPLLIFNKERHFSRFASSYRLNSSWFFLSLPFSVFDGVTDRIVKKNILRFGLSRCTPQN
jgi:hypothetical protein